MRTLKNPKRSSRGDLRKLAETPPSLGLADQRNVAFQHGNDENPVQQLFSREERTRGLKIKKSAEDLRLTCSRQRTKTPLRTLVTGARPVHKDQNNGKKREAGAPPSRARDSHQRKKATRAKKTPAHPTTLGYEQKFHTKLRDHTSKRRWPDSVKRGKCPQASTKKTGRKNGTAPRANAKTDGTDS